jgi:hypothetical protein
MESTTHANEDHARLIHHRVLETLGEVLSELSTRLLSSGRKQFAEIAPNIFQAVAQIYIVYVDRTILSINQIASAAVEKTEIELDIVATCVRCLRILMVSGIRDVHKYNETRVSSLLVLCIYLCLLIFFDDRHLSKSVENI